MSRSRLDHPDNTPKVSVIIPCYNLGGYIDEAVASVLAQTFQEFEIIVVDDGSTDTATVRILDHYSRAKTRVIRINNQGLATALNVGIAQAQGKYILPLSADDRIGESYLAKASQILDTNPAIGIVYCRARLFGARDREWDLPPYSLETMLVRNVIFASAMFRKSSWQEVSGYNVNMVHGMEDYDFWLSLLERENTAVYRINEVLFYYRIRDDSKTATLNVKEQNEIDMFTTLFYNHADYFLRDKRMRVLMANWIKTSKRLERLRAMIRNSPALRFEARLDAYPQIKSLYALLFHPIMRLLVFAKKKIRK